MPKIKEREEDLKNKRLLSIVTQKMILCGIKNKGDLTKIIGGSMPTAYKRINYPETLTLKEIRKMDKKFHFTAEELREMI